MLLKLSRSAEYNEFVQPLCLPSTRLSDYGEPGTNFDNNRALAVGWGYTQSKKDQGVTTVGTAVQQMVEMPAIGNSDCLAGFKKFTGIDLTDTLKPDYHLCAGGVPGKDSCRGDSGGPLMGRVNGLSPWQLVGIVSAGSSRCGVGLPALFTRVTKYQQWIEDNMI